MGKRIAYSDTCDDYLRKCDVIRNCFGNIFNISRYADCRDQFVGFTY